jgi:DNA polymerase III subunit beta
MKFSITQENLAASLAAVIPAIPSRSTLPVLANVHLEAADGVVHLTATDLDVRIRVSVPAEVKQPGVLTLPGKKLQEVVRALPRSVVTADRAGNVMSLSCGSARFRLNGVSAEEFPGGPNVGAQQSFHVRASLLQDLSQRTRFCASTEETRPILRGVLWQIREHEMRMVATNGHRLARASSPIAAGIGQADLIVPTKAMEQVERLFAGDDDVEVFHSDSFVGFRKDGVEISVRLIEGPYPNYEQIIPKDNDRELVAEKDGLASSIRRMAVVASDETRRLRLTLGGDTLKLTAQTPDLGEASEDMPGISYTGEGMDVCFNAAYLLDVLKFIPGERVRITFKAPERAAMLMAEGDAGTYACLLMPLRVN